MSRTVTYTFTATDLAGNTTSHTVPVVVEDSVPGSRFPGDPGVGNILIGNNGGPSADHDIDEFDQILFGGSPTPNKRCSTVRIYNGSAMALSSGLRAELQGYANQGRIPAFSTKYGGLTAAQMASGAADTTWQNTAAWLADQYNGIMHYSPVGHEPEDNFDSSPQVRSDYRAAFRRAVQVHMNHRPSLANKVAFCGPWLMEFSYDGPRDYRNWHPNWSGTNWLHDGPFDVECADGSIYEGSWIHLDAIDLYNPSTGGNIGSGARNQSWTTSIQAFMNDRENANQPPLLIHLGEHGLYTHVATLDDNGTTVADVYNQEIDIGAANDGLVAVCHWTNDLASFPNDPGNVKRNALRAVAQRPEVIKV